MMTVQIKVGKLAEVVYRPPMTVEQLSAFVSDIRTNVEKAHAPLCFICDWRAVDIFDATFADTIVWTMRRDNPKVVVNAILVGRENLALYDQVSSFLREAKKAERKVFRKRAELSAYLWPYLSHEEQARCDDFLDGRDQAVHAH